MTIEQFPVWMRRDLACRQLVEAPCRARLASPVPVGEPVGRKKDGDAPERRVGCGP